LSYYIQKEELEIPKIYNENFFGIKLNLTIQKEHRS